MKFKNLISFIGYGLVVSALFVPTLLSAQNLQSVSGMKADRFHADRLANQTNSINQIRDLEAKKYANRLYEENEPEPDIYTEGWASGLVNSYKNAIIPNSKRIDVSNFCIPCPGIVTSPYGYRPRFRRMHKGIDLRASIGDTIKAAFDGVVRLTKYEGRGYGFYVIVRHSNGLETVYGHLSKFLVRPDQRVKAGTPIALSGNTGHSTGPHLHFETRFMGLAINPAAIFDFDNQTTHTDFYTFNKNTYEQARDYSPAARYRASVARESSEGRVTTPSKYKSSRKSSGNSSYKIRKGDNLGKIASRNNMTVAQLCKLNGITSKSVINAGKVLRLK